MFRPVRFLAFVTSTLTAFVASAIPPPQPVATRWVCAVAYLPARTTWVRAVEVEHDEHRVRAVRIDGVAVYSFQVHDALIVTALDNERITFDTATLTWRSDFRGLSTGEGRCER